MKIVTLAVLAFAVLSARAEESQPFVRGELTIGSIHLTGITAVTKTTPQNVVVRHSKGLTTLQIQELPHAFLAAWNVSRESPKIDPKNYNLSREPEAPKPTPEERPEEKPKIEITAKNLNFELTDLNFRWIKRQVDLGGAFTISPQVTFAIKGNGNSAIGPLLFKFQFLQRDKEETRIFDTVEVYGLQQRGELPPGIISSTVFVTTSVGAIAEPKGMFDTSDAAEGRITNARFHVSIWYKDDLAQEWKEFGSVQFFSWRVVKQ